jgi:hypothetical protein
MRTHTERELDALASDRGSVEQRSACALPRFVSLTSLTDLTH